MEVKDMKLQDIMERRTAITDEIEVEGTDLEALTEEVRMLEERQAEIEKEIELKTELRKKAITAPIIESPKETKMEERIFTSASPEYRTGWLKRLQGKELDEVEQRAVTAASAIPDSTANMIMEKMVDMVPLLNEIELFRVPGNLTVSVESVAPVAELKAGASASTDQTVTLTEVNLTGYTINSFVRLGADTAAMAISAFEEWLVRKLTEGIAYKIEAYIISGDGSSKPKGITKASVGATFVDTTDGVNFASGTLAVVDLDEAIGMLPAAYDRNAKFLCSKKTFFASVIGLTDTNNVPVVTYANGKYYIRGFEVIWSDQVAAANLYFGDFKRGIVGNLGADIRIEKGRNLEYNAWDFLGWAVFDCEPAVKGAIIRLAADVTA
jgi:HK97 family phage major capsid protein